MSVGHKYLQNLDHVNDLFGGTALIMVMINLR